MISRKREFFSVDVSEFVNARQSHWTSQMDLDHAAQALLIPEECPVEVLYDLASSVPVGLLYEVVNHLSTETRVLVKVSQRLESAIASRVHASWLVANNSMAPNDVRDRMEALSTALQAARRQPDPNQSGSLDLPTW